MAAYKDKAKNTWYTSFYYENWKGEKNRKLKRGFTTKKAALEWEREFLNQISADLDMTFESFVEIYKKDMQGRLKQITWETKNSIIETKIMPSFGKKKMNEIKSSDVIQWQNDMINFRDENDRKYAGVYLKMINSQLNAIFNHAEKFYELKVNPAKKTRSIGTIKCNAMKFWTKDEYIKFTDYTGSKPTTYHAFEMLYWCGIRVGELLALTPADFDFVKRTVSITKTYQRIKGKEVITTPKTVKSNRIIKMPGFLNQEIQTYIKTFYGIKPTDRIFPITTNYLHYEMTRGCDQQGLKRIRIHDLRHSHVSLLIEMGFSAVAIADRLGHESINITYRYAHLFPSIQSEMADKLNSERGDAINFQK